MCSAIISSIAFRFPFTKAAVIVLPFFIAIFYMITFTMLDKYPYSAFETNDQGLSQRIASNLINQKAFSGADSLPFQFCPVRPPLYSFMLAGIWKISGNLSLMPVRVFQSFLYLLTLFLIYKIATIVSNGDRYYGYLLRRPVIRRHFILAKNKFKVHI